MTYGPEIFLTDEERRERRNLVQLEVSHIEEERRREDDACKHAEQRSVEREEAMNHPPCPVCGLWPHQSWCPERP